MFLKGLLNRKKRIETKNRNRLLREVNSNYRYTVEEYLLNKFAENKARPASHPFVPDSFILFNYLKIFALFNESNLGDYIQTISVKKALESLYGQDLKFEQFDRDNLFYYKRQDGASANPPVCVMQGWFSHTFAFLPNKDILPVYVGSHLTRAVQNFVINLLALDPRYFAGFEVGCRDLSTLDFCRRFKIGSYFSRCLTLTLPRRKDDPKNGRIFIVDMPDKLLRIIPKSIRANAVSIPQKALKLSGEIEDELIRSACGLLERFKSEASLVITTALHCASPCIAMGIPVVLIAENPDENMKRFSSLDGILRIYTKEDLEGLAQSLWGE